jgi:RNA polymerase sigma-70 factor (ECF subfamily)
MSEISQDELQAQFMALAPNLRAFARSLAGNTHEADDLVQETLIKAWTKRHTFAAGSNMKAWLFTILRNTHISQRRKLKNEVFDADGTAAEALSERPSQIGHMDMLDFSHAFAQLSPEHKEALILVGAEGFAYEDAALMCGCAVGTMKSRVNRARTRLAELMGIEGSSDIGTDFQAGTLASRATPSSSPR